jgi:hypothetical protein
VQAAVVVQQMHQHPIQLLVEHLAEGCAERTLAPAALGAVQVPDHIRSPNARSSLPKFTLVVDEELRCADEVALPGAIKEVRSPCLSDDQILPALQGRLIRSNHCDVSRI